MPLSLGISASAVASHCHDSPAPLSPSMTPTEERTSGYDLFSPLRYLQGRWQALTEPDAQGELPAGKADMPPASAMRSPVGDAANCDARDDASEPSCAASLFDGSTGGDARSLRLTPRCSRTTYQLCLPPPHKGTGRFRVRRRLLLQLRAAPRGQQRAAAPVLELFAIGNLSCSVTRSRGKRPSFSTPAPEDFVISSCESYARYSPDKATETSAPSDEEEAAEAHRTVARIRHGGPEPDPRRGAAPARAEIKIGATTWRASALANGYEFVRVGSGTGAGGCGGGSGDDDMPAQVRWVGRGRAKKRRSQSDPPAPSSTGSAARPSAPAAAPRTFRFILVSAHGRRHPVVGHLDRAALHVFNQYPLPSASGTTPPLSAAPSFEPSHPPTPTSAAAASLATFSPLEPAAAARPLVATTDAVRALALITAVWVALAEGWLPGSVHGPEAAVVPPLPPPTPQPPAAAAGLGPPRAGNTGPGRRSTSSPVTDAKPPPRAVSPAKSAAGLVRTGSAPAASPARHAPRETRPGLKGLAIAVEAGDGCIVVDEEAAGGGGPPRPRDAHPAGPGSSASDLDAAARWSLADGGRPSCETLGSVRQGQGRRRHEVGRRLLGLVRRPHRARAER